MAENFFSKSFPSRLALALFFASVFFLGSPVSFARAPTIMFAYPAGGQRGSSFKMELGVLDAYALSGISISGGGVGAKLGKVKELSAERKKAAAARDEAKGMKMVEVFVEISGDAEIGMRDIRLTNRDGTSNRFRFFVGEIPEVMEKKASLQVLPNLPVCVNGQILEADKDRYEFSLPQGAVFVAELYGRAIKPYIADAVPGWFQPVMSLYDDKGKEVVYVDDYGISPDPVIIYKVPRSGKYVLEVRDAMFRGRDDFVYRIRMGEIPFISYVYPMGAAIGSKTSLGIYGANLPSSGVSYSSSGNFPHLEEFRMKNGRLYSNPIVLDIDEKPEFEIPSYGEVPDVVSEYPAVFNGKFSKAREAGFVKFFVKAGSTVVMETFARRLGGVADTKLTLYDAKTMRVLASNDDYDDPSFGLITHNSDSRIIRKFDKDSECVLKVEEAQRHFGDEYVFRLKISENKPDFTVRISPDNPQVGCDSFTPLKVSVMRMGGFDGQIEISASNLPKGFSAEKCVVEKGKNDAIICVKASSDAPRESFNPEFEATAVVGGKKVSKPAQASEELMQAFYYTHTVPVGQISMSVLPRAPFKIEWCEIPDEPLSFAAGNSHELEMRVVREDGFDKPINISLLRGLPGMQSKTTRVKPDEEKIMVKFQSTQNVSSIAEGYLIVVGTARDGNNSYQTVAPLGAKYRVYPRPSNIKKR